MLHGYKRFCCIRYTASTNSAYYCILYLYTQTNHVCDFITLNYTTMSHCVGIYWGTVAFYRHLTRITVSDIKPEWIWHHSTRNNIRKNDTGLTGMMHFFIFRSITRLQTILLHSIQCKHQLRIIEYILICIHKLITFVTLLHLITPQWPIASEFVREQSHFIAI